MPWPRPESTRSPLIWRGYSLGAFTKAYWGTGSVCTGVVAATPGTVINDLVRRSALDSGTFRIAHPSGVITVDIAIDRAAGGHTVVRKARRIMFGHVEVPADRVFID